MRLASDQLQRMWPSKMTTMEHIVICVNTLVHKIEKKEDDLSDQSASADEDSKCRTLIWKTALATRFGHSYHRKGGHKQNESQPEQADSQKHTATGSLHFSLHFRISTIIWITFYYKNLRRSQDHCKKKKKQKKNKTPSGRNLGGKRYTFRSSTWKNKSHTQVGIKLIYS